jgi:hypothetical protein
MHLLRDRFNYETIPWNAIDNIEVHNGKDLKNWLWVLVVGAALSIYALWDIFQILYIFRDPNTHLIYVERLVIPVIPLSLGVYSIFIALRNTRVMKVKSATKFHYLSLRDIIKRRQFMEFVGYMEMSHPSFKNKARF